MYDIQAKANEFRQNGFCLLEGLFNEADIARLQNALDTYWASQGSPSMAGTWGFSVNPLAALVPETVAAFGQPVVVAVLKELLEDEVRLVHAGARMSSSDGAPVIGWHNHYAWDASGLPGRAKPERILIGVYLEGSSPDVGPLVVWPRKVGDPLSEPPADFNEDWPGQLKVDAPRGSVAIFDTALWHTAHAGTQPGIRHLFGAHLQGWSDTRPHPEDNPIDVPGMEPYIEANPVLRGLIKGNVS